MSLITENEIKRIIKDGKYIQNDVIKLPKNAMLTPSAQSVISENKIVIKFIEDEVENSETNVFKNASNMSAEKLGRFKSENGWYIDKKHEHMTQLYGNVLVYKDHKRIKLRGEVDLFMNEIMKVQIRAVELNLKTLISDLSEVFSYVGELSRCEVLNEPMKIDTILGLKMNEIREVSHHPKKYFDRDHLFNITYETGEVPVLISVLRAMARRVEIVCYEAFKNEDGSAARDDLVQGYNRLSSVLYIIIFRYLELS